MNKLAQAQLLDKKSAEKMLSWGFRWDDSAECRIFLRIDPAVVQVNP
jgi:hypothetical protein